MTNKTSLAITNITIKTVELTYFGLHLHQTSSDRLNLNVVMSPFNNVLSLTQSRLY